MKKNEQAIGVGKSSDEITQERILDTKERQSFAIQHRWVILSFALAEIQVASDKDDMKLVKAIVAECIKKLKAIK